ncbi:MAG: hypothetical protein FJ403_21270 [Verrucomicrobia bacterium]|nr:hypothetical protein [Verrucomicrobiota bacterium]
MSKSSSSLKELKGLREAVLAEEKTKTQARLQNLPPNPITAPRPEPVLTEPPAWEPTPDDLVESAAPVAAPPSAPAPARPQAAPAAIKTPPPSAPAANRNKAGADPALIIPLTPKIQERLQKHVDSTRWSQADLVIELIRAFLHRGYPEIQFGEQLIARGGTYRTFERNPLDTVLKIVSGQGIFNVTVKSETPDCQNWLSYFNNQKAQDPEKAALQVCLFTLQSYLENVDDYQVQGWVKNISPDAYTVISAS